MDTKKLGQSIFLVVGLITGVIAVVLILLNPTGGIAGLSKFLALIGIVIGLLNPRFAILFLSAQSIYSDEIKRIGVYYGVESTVTVSEILIGPLLTLCAINISYLYSVIQGKYRLGKLGWSLYAIIPTIAVIMLATGESELGLSLKLYNIGTTCLYMTLLPVCYGLYSTLEDWVDMVSAQVVLAAPAAAWGLWQYKYGFNNIEWTYALSGLSKVHYIQMTILESPRIFGLFGSASAYGCTSIYGIFSVWHGLRFKKMRFLFLLLGFLYLTCIVCSEQRTILVYPIIVFLFTFGFRRISTTLFLYGGFLFTFVLGVFNSKYLLDEGLDQINSVIANNSNWGKSVLNVNTFSDRLRGWIRLTKADTWSLIGTRWEAKDTVSSGNYYSDDYNHDIINKILMNTGAIGLFLAMAVGGFLLFKFHQVIFKSTDPQLRKDGAFSMACIVPTLLLSAIAGDNFTTNPINLQIWTIFAGIFVLRRITEKRKWQGTQSDPTPISNFAPQQNS